MKALLNKKITVDAEMFGKASYFVSRNDWRPFYKGICITQTSTLNEGINIIGSDGTSLVIFNNSACDNFNFSHSSGSGIYINCVYDKNKLTNFIKECRNKVVLKKHQNIKLTFLKNSKCRIRFNNRQYTFKYGTDFPTFDHIVSKIKIPLKNEAMSYNPKFIQKIKHIDLSWHPKGGVNDLLLLSRCDSGQLLAIKPGVIYIAMPLFRSTKKSAIQRFVRGISSDSKDSDDLFSAAFKKQAYKKEFGSLLANDLLSKKASF